MRNSLITGSLVVFALFGPTAFADEADQLREKIAEQNAKIEEIEQEIKQYEGELEIIGEEKQTLQSAINSLDVSRQKIGADINLTENRIETTSLEIQRLGIEIGGKEEKIETNRAAIAEALRNINQIESDSLVEALLAHERLNEVWDRVTTLEQFQLAMRDDIQTLIALKDDLQDRQEESEDKKQDLTSYKSQLSGQKRVLDENRNEKNQLLDVTKNREAGYQQLLADRQAAREQFERELLDFEAQLEFALDPEAIPPEGQGILAWPLDNLTVTQYFGNTAFAQSGAYNGRGHNGVDFRASTGSRVKASLSGKVLGAGNTDQYPGCYSYGKWVLLGHNNGLATLYAHLSVITVGVGQTVTTGDVIGFSGNTGYSTGPHLHYSVYLADAVQIVRLGDVKTITNCGLASIPIAPLQAYLNPLDYLRGGDTLR